MCQRCADGVTLVYRWRVARVPLMACWIGPSRGGGRRKNPSGPLRPLSTKTPSTARCLNVGGVGRRPRRTQGQVPGVPGKKSWNQFPGETRPGPPPPSGSAARPASPSGEMPREGSPGTLRLCIHTEALTLRPPRVSANAPDAQTHVLPKESRKLAARRSVSVLAPSITPLPTCGQRGFHRRHTRCSMLSRWCQACDPCACRWCTVPVVSLC